MTAVEIQALMKTASECGVTKADVAADGSVSLTFNGYRPATSPQSAYQQAVEAIQQESQAALDWATAEPPPVPAESM